ncbi:MAG: DUF1330 domain-containing protein, partial [Actinobacteria bacterium]|nr:DUF1330 domain-containing protein [Actinomycetota bacterium]
MQVSSLLFQRLQIAQMEVWKMSEEIKPAYGLVQINITNQAEFMERYAQHVFPILEKWGIEMIAGSDTPVTKEGTFKFAKFGYCRGHQFNTYGNGLGSHLILKWFNPYHPFLFVNFSNCACLICKLSISDR